MVIVAAKAAALAVLLVGCSGSSGDQSVGGALEEVSPASGAAIAPESVDPSPLPSPSPEPKPFIGEGAAYDAMPAAGDVSEVFGSTFVSLEISTIDRISNQLPFKTQPQRCLDGMEMLVNSGMPNISGQQIFREYTAEADYLVVSIGFADAIMDLDNVQSMFEMCDSFKATFPSGAVTLQLADQYYTAKIRGVSRPSPDTLVVDARLGQLTYVPLNFDCGSNWTRSAGEWMCPLEYVTDLKLAYMQMDGTSVMVQAGSIVDFRGKKVESKKASDEQVLELLTRTASMASESSQSS